MNCSEKPIRILQVFSSLNMGGAESRMMDVFRNIDRNRFDFTFISMTNGPQYYEDEINKLGGKVIKIPSPREDGVINHFTRLYGVIKNGDYQVVHAHTSFHCGIAMLAAWLAKTPIRISHSRTTGSKNHSFKNRISLIFGRLLIGIFSTNRLAISDEAGCYLFNKKEYIVLPNAIDCEKYFNTTNSAVERLRFKYSIPNDSICLGLVGRFDNMKNHDFAVSIVESYRKKHGNACLIFVGDGILREQVQEKVRLLNLSDNVYFVGIQNNVNEWMRLFDVLLVPSIFEGLGGVILEAQASGIPVVKSDSFTNEADMKIGLVEEVSIFNGVQPWVSAIEKALKINLPNRDTICEAFNRRGYNLSGEIEKLQQIYRGETL